MKDLKAMLQFVNKPRLILVLVLDLIYNAAFYGVIYAEGANMTSPLTADKLIRLLTVFIILYFVAVFSRYFFLKISQVFLYHIQLSAEQFFYKKLIAIDPKNIIKYHTGYIQSLVMTTSEEYACFFETIISEVIPIIIGLGAFVFVVFRQSIFFGSILLALFLAILIIHTRLTKRKAKYLEQFSKSRGEYYGNFVDFVQNIFTVKKLGAKDFTESVLSKRTDQFVSDLQALENKSAKYSAIKDALVDTIYVVVMIAAIVAIQKGEDVLPFLVFCFGAISRVATNISSFSREYEHIVKFWALKHQLDEILVNDSEASTIKRWKKLQIKDGEFSYENRSKTIIRIPDFNFKLGDKISIMGESGQGKTTILNILSGIFPLKFGEILIDGKKHAQPRLDVVYISQDVELFDLSIRENLTLGKNIPDERILEMLTDAGLKEWYHGLEHGLDDIIGERGVRLSAGQRQRLNLIRGILIDKDVYFLDEPTSNLDKESEAKIIEMIKKYLDDKTYIIVTHRDGLTELCDKHYKFSDHALRESK